MDNDKNALTKFNSNILPVLFFDKFNELGLIYKTYLFNLKCGMLIKASIYI